MIKEIDYDANTNLIVLDATSFNTGYFKNQEYWSMNMIKNNTVEFYNTQVEVETLENGLPTEVIYFNNPVDDGAWTVLETAFYSECQGVIKKRYDSNLNIIN